MSFIVATFPSDSEPDGGGERSVGGEGMAAGGAGTQEEEAEKGACSFIGWLT